jgi:cation:H+ antiporter
VRLVFIVCAVPCTCLEIDINYLVFIEAGVGLALLLFAADYLVRGAVSLARLSGVSPLIIGLSVVAIGTSAPEFVTALAAAHAGATDMAIGNVVGSNNVNMLLILGIAAMIRPINVATKVIARDAMMVVGATALFVAIGVTGGYNQWQGALLLSCLIGYLYLTYKAEKAENNKEALHAREAEDVGGVPERGGIAALFLIGGLVGIVIGAELLVRGGLGIAEIFDVSRTIVGLTLIAVGTSLPELAIVIVASWRGHSDIALGNVLGSNIFNLLGITGGVAMIIPLEMPIEVITFDIWVLLGVTILLLPLMITENKISRMEGRLLAGLYFLYLAAQLGPVRQLFT